MVDEYCERCKKITIHYDGMCILCFSEKRAKARANFMKRNPDINPDSLMFRDYRIEWYCSHKIGHTVWAYVDKRDKVFSDYRHGCDGCCSKIKQLSKKEQQ